MDRNVRNGRFEDAPINVGLGKTQIRKDVRNNSRVIIDDEILAIEIWKKVENICLL